MVKFLLVLTSVLFVCRAADETYLTHGRPNGRIWQGMNAAQKNGFVVGIDEGLFIALLSVDSATRDKIMSRYPKDELDPSDYAIEMDKIYAERENINIPLFMAYTWVQRKLKGDLTKDQLEAELRRLRTISSQ
jgi:hypothetical protein